MKQLPYINTDVCPSQNMSYNTKHYPFELSYNDEKSMQFFYFIKLGSPSIFQKFCHLKLFAQKCAFCVNEVISWHQSQETFERKFMFKNSITFFVSLGSICFRFKELYIINYSCWSPCQFLEKKRQESTIFLLMFLTTSV